MDQDRRKGERAYVPGPPKADTDTQARITAVRALDKLKKVDSDLAAALEPYVERRGRASAKGKPLNR